jgi:hypothetical protein
MAADDPGRVRRVSERSTDRRDPGFCHEHDERMVLVARGEEFVLATTNGAPTIVAVDACPFSSERSVVFAGRNAADWELNHDFVAVTEEPGRVEHLVGHGVLHHVDA